jgi:molybdopterin synthase catalytic subunit
VAREAICRVVTGPVDEAGLAREVRSAADGAVATFVGVVRDHHRQRPVDHLEYHAYPAMAVEELQRIADELARSHDVGRIALVHRTGRLQVGEISVVVAVAAAHRGPALACCAAGIEAVKARAPIWKKEFFADGGEPEWVYGPDEKRGCHG